MATNYKDLYNVLNELRIDQGMTIADLCLDIMSERTFLRYLKVDHLEMKNQVFTKLLKRLDIDFLQFMLYYTHYYQKDSGIYRFIGRIRFAHYTDIVPIYELILNYKSANLIDELLIKTYINIYEFDSKKINEAQFKQRFLRIIADLPPKDSDHLYTEHILLLFAAYYPQESDLDIDNLIAELLNNNSYLFMFVKIMHLYTLVLYALEYDTLKLETFKKLLDSFEFHIKFTAQKNNYALLSLGRAYISYKEKDNENLAKHLWESSLNAVVISDKHQFSHYERLVLKRFNINIKTFMQDYAKTGLGVLDASY